MNQLGFKPLFCLLCFLCAAALRTAAASNQELAAKQRSFADTLTSDLYNNENECSSALGVSMAFDLIYPSSTGETKEDMEDVFGFSSSASPAKLQWDDTASRLRAIYHGDCLVPEKRSSDGSCKYAHDPSVFIANSVWISNAINLSTSYAQVVGKYVRQIDFTDTGAGGLINNWVAEETHGLIDSIVQEGALPANWIVLAINTLFLKASWAKPFSELLTNEDAFYTSVLRDDPVEASARFMHMVDYFQYSHTALPGHQIVRLPFAGRNGETSGLSMIFVLPTIRDCSAVSSVDLAFVLPELENQRVAVALPKFKYVSEYSDSLATALQSIGLVALFSGGLCVQEGLCDDYLDFVVQKTIIDVNEDGVEAAAATMVAVGKAALPVQDQPVLFMADHPFQFFIYEDNEEVFLFEGRVVNPGIPEGAPVYAQLEAVHADQDFWSDNFGVDPVQLEDTILVQGYNNPELSSASSQTRRSSGLKILLLSLTSLLI